MTAVIRGPDVVPGGVERLRQPGVAQGVLRETVSDLYHSSYGLNPGRPLVADDLHAVLVRGEISGDHLPQRRLPPPSPGGLPDM